jgi:hypothetical protein
MIPNLSSAADFLVANLFCVFLLIVVFISWHAFADANEQLRKTQSLYNKQPRVKPLRSRLKWPARLLSLFTFNNDRL